MRAFLFPGQGSQKVGMGEGLSRRRFDEADDALGYSLSKIIDAGPDAELVRTQNTQPAILTVSVAYADMLKQRGVEAEIAAGHSLGEYSALVYAGALEFADAVRLVHLRGKFMQEAVPEGTGAMAAIIGLDASTVADTCREASPDESDACQPANFNGAGQVVIAGHKGAVERAMALAKQKGAKLVKALPVSAPFHSALMQPAADAMRAAFAPVAKSAPAVPIVSNVGVEPLSDPEAIVAQLVAQVTGRVRWRETVEWFGGNGVTTLYEIGAGKVLSSLARRINRDIATAAVGNPAEVEAALAALA
jgi:[acyl-carrier-protein] S-malonyltransferase